MEKRKKFPKCSALFVKFSTRCADDIQETMEKGISCSVAFIVSIGFYLSRKTAYQLSQTISKLCSNREETKKSNFPNLKRNTVTVGRMSEW